MQNKFSKSDKIFTHFSEVVHFMNLKSLKHLLHLVENEVGCRFCGSKSEYTFFVEPDTNNEFEIDYYDGYIVCCDDCTNQDSKPVKLTPGKSCIEMIKSIILIKELHE